MSREPQQSASGGLPSRRIQRLPDALIDQIAAGEVVERPASVVKELVENAVDAGARRIRVEIRGGGADLIAVTDDGSGMTPGDARLALERHATSKITGLDDLLGIRSFGFRGEALPAIASVSRLRLRSRAQGSAEGFELRVDGGRLLESGAVGSPLGTRVEVADLFASVPARRKFLKSPATEWGHAAEWLGRAALALSSLHFDVRRDGRDALHWPAVADPLDRIAAVLSEREAAALVSAQRDMGSARLQAFVSRPDAHRPTGAGIHLFVNGRPVRDRLLRHALLQVMRDLIPRGRFPTALLFLEVAPQAVDVNVHPAKWEVRFSDPQGIHSLVTATVGEAVASRSWLGRGGQGRPAPPTAGLVAERPRTSWPDDWRFARQQDLQRSAARPLDAKEGEGGHAPGAAPSPGARPFRFGELRLVGQILATYLVVEGKEGLLLVDQHAAHERVLYERLRAAWLEGGAERQVLLAPAPLELAPRSAAALLEAAETTLALGFEVEPFGEGVVMVRAVPALLADRDPLGLLRGLAAELVEAGGARLAPGTRILDAADHLFATLACHAARRAGEVLPAQELEALLDALDAIPWAPTCPHGRPVAVPFARSEIERRFGRS